MNCNHYNWPTDCPCINAAEDARDNPADDYAADFVDNAFERANYPRQWDS